jgi:hypothetical protein
VPTLLDLVAASVRLKRRGRAYWAPCPFHNEKTSSFKVEERGGKQRYHCFGCGAHGDAADWIMRTQRVDFKEAKRILGEATARPDPAILAARIASRWRELQLDRYRLQHPDCCCPDWLLFFSDPPRGWSPPKERLSPPRSEEEIEQIIAAWAALAPT